MQQAEHALRICFLNFLDRADWDSQPTHPAVDADGRVDPIAVHRHVSATTQNQTRGALLFLAREGAGGQ